jgi:hypothetical protein
MELEIGLDLQQILSELKGRKEPKVLKDLRGLKEVVTQLFMARLIMSGRCLHHQMVLVILKLTMVILEPVLLNI